MDFDRNNAVSPMGADGCIDWDHPANSGLETIWCDDGSCPLTEIYQEKYSFMSRADYWVAASNAVIKLRSPNNELDLKSTFKWGRVDADQCPDAALRLPGDTDCGEVQDVFLNRLGLTWTDAVALLGAHTVGRGSSDFSGHDGIWVDTNQEATIFDKRYYEEVLRRAWVPRNEGTALQDWTWGGGNNGSPRFMLNTDMCLLFDVETTFPCCTRTDLTRNDGSNQCDTNNSVLRGTECGRTTNEEAAAAVLLFADQRDDNDIMFNNDNGPFFTAFSAAWEAATTNGWDNLQELSLSCGTVSPTPAPSTQLPTLPSTPGPTQVPTVPPTPVRTEFPTPPPTPVRTELPTVLPTPGPTQVPTLRPTPGPTQLPTAPPSPVPTQLPTPFQVPTAPPTTSPTQLPTPLPTQLPTTTIPAADSCVDVDSLIHNGKTKDCEWVIINQRCQPYAHLCPVSCDQCECLLRRSVCISGEDCCSGVCVAGECACLSKNELCSSNDQCCSGLCRDDGTCAGSSTVG